MDETKHDVQYMAGQIECLRAMLLGLGQFMARENFAALCLDRLEMTRTAMLGTAVSEVELLAVDDFERWLRHATGAVR